MRRRGPRSQVGIARRQEASVRGHSSYLEKGPSGQTVVPPGDGPCESGPLSPEIMHSFTFLHHNIRGFLSHKYELEVLLEANNYPMLVALTETFLNRSVQVPKLLGYTVVGRRDRGKRRRQKGGIILFARQETARYVALLVGSDHAERLWAVVHTDVGPILFGVWYLRPIYGEVHNINSLESELLLHGHGTPGSIICGDMNVHHIGWLTHSNTTTPEGRSLFDLCCVHLCLNAPRNQPEGNTYLISL